MGSILHWYGSPQTVQMAAKGSSVMSINPFVWPDEDEASHPDLQQYVIVHSIEIIKPVLI